MRTTCPGPDGGRLSAVVRLRQRVSDEHTPEYAALLRALLRSAIDVVAALKADAADPAPLGRAVTQYIERALNAGISRARIREALELLVHDHGGPRSCAVAAAIGLLAMRSSPPAMVGPPHSY